MRRRQRGMTFLGLLILVTFVGLFVYGGIRLLPAYLEYFKVSRVLDELRTETTGAATPQTVRNALEKRFDIESIGDVDWRDIEITRDGDALNVRAAYEVAKPFVGNVGFVVRFDKTVSVPVQR